MRLLALTILIGASLTLAQQSPCASILESAIYNSMYINNAGAGSTSGTYKAFLQALCSLPPGLSLPLSATPTLLEAFNVVASALLIKTSAQWEYPGKDYDDLSFATSNVLKMVTNLNKAVCYPDMYTVRTSMWAYLSSSTAVEHAWNLPVDGGIP